MSRHALRIIVALLTFAAGVVATTLWLRSRQQPAPSLAVPTVERLSYVRDYTILPIPHAEPRQVSRFSRPDGLLKIAGGRK